MTLLELFELVRNNTRGKDVEVALATTVGGFSIKVSKNNRVFSLEGNIPTYTSPETITFLTISKVGKTVKHVSYPRIEDVLSSIRVEVALLDEDTGDRFQKDPYGRVVLCKQETKEAKEAPKNQSPKRVPLFLTPETVCDAISSMHLLLDQHKKTELYMHQIMRYIRKGLTEGDQECK